jgi:hypothetical protein
VGVCKKPLEMGESLTPLNFKPNTVFVDFLHEVIARRGPESSSLQSAARAQGEGWVYLIDARTPTPEGDVPVHDILGAFAVKSGELVAGSYQPNRHHTILSPDGIFQLESTLFESLMEELIARHPH